MVASHSSLRSCLKIRSVGQRASEKVVSEAGEAGESSGFVDAAQRSLTAFAAARSQDGILRQLLRQKLTETLWSYKATKLWDGSPRRRNADCGEIYGTNGPKDRRTDVGDIGRRG